MARVHQSTAAAPQELVTIDRSYLADEPLDRIAPWLERYGHDTDALRRVVDDVFRLVDAAADGSTQQDWEHYVAWFRFPDEETKARCLAPLGLEKVQGPTYPVVLGEVWVTAYVEGLQVVFRLEPGPSGQASLIDAARARTAARAFEHLEILRFRVL